MRWKVFCIRPSEVQQRRGGVCTYSVFFRSCFIPVYTAPSSSLFGPAFSLPRNTLDRLIDALSRAARVAFVLRAAEMLAESPLRQASKQTRNARLDRQ